MFEGVCHILNKQSLAHEARLLDLAEAGYVMDCVHAFLAFFRSDPHPLNRSQTWVQPELAFPACSGPRGPCAAAPLSLRTSGLGQRIHDKLKGSTLAADPGSKLDAD